MVRSTAMAPWRESTATVTTVSVSMAMGCRGMEGLDVGEGKGIEWMFGDHFKK